VIFTEDPENTQNNTLVLYAFRHPKNAIVTDDREGKGFLEGKSFTASVNGTEYRNTRGHYSTEGFYYYTFIPAEDGPTPVPVEGTCTVTISYKESSIDVEPIQITLEKMEGKRAYQQVTGEGTTLTILPLTENLVAGNFSNPAWADAVSRADYVSARADFITNLANGGGPGFLNGPISINGLSDSSYCMLVRDRDYNAGISSAACSRIDLSLDYNGGTLEEAYSFPLMTVGETITVGKAIWEDLGFSCTLESITRTEKGIEFALSYEFHDEMLLSADVQVNEYSMGVCTDRLHGTRDNVTRTVWADETGALYTNDGMEDILLREGDILSVRIRGVEIEYGRPDRSLAGFLLD